MHDFTPEFDAAVAAWEQRGLKHALSPQVSEKFVAESLRRLKRLLMGIDISFPKGMETLLALSMPFDTIPLAEQMRMLWIHGDDEAYQIIEGHYPAKTEPRPGDATPRLLLYLHLTPCEKPTITEMQAILGSHQMLSLSDTLGVMLMMHPKRRAQRPIVVPLEPIGPNRCAMIYEDGKGLCLGDCSMNHLPENAVVMTCQRRLVSMPSDTLVLSA